MVKHQLVIAAAAKYNIPIECCTGVPISYIYIADVVILVDNDSAKCFIAECVLYNYIHN